MKTTLAIVGLAWSTAGCGLMLNSANQTVYVNSEPISAEVRRGPGELQYWTPARMRLARKRSYQLTFELAGYETATLTLRRRVNPQIVILDVLTTAGVGLVVDALTGSYYEIEPEDVFVSLTPIPAVTPVASNPVGIELGVEEKGTVTVRSSQPGVRIVVKPIS